MNQSIIEKVAEAIALDRTLLAWYNLNEAEKETWRKTAKAAIQASELSTTVYKYNISTDEKTVVTQEDWDLMEYKFTYFNKLNRILSYTNLEKLKEDYYSK